MGGQVIRTTAEHPFYAEGRGWVACVQLGAGERVRGRAAGEWLAVEAVADTGELTTVYNFRVAQFHTYFVGMEER